jgi:AraC family transcriptional regulator
MRKTVAHQIECASVPIFSSRHQGWENILVEQFQYPAGEGKLHYRDEHVLCMSLAPRPVRLLQIQDGKTYSGLYGKGDLSFIALRSLPRTYYRRRENRIRITNVIPLQ